MMFMGVPTYIIIASFLVSILVIVLLRVFRVSIKRSRAVLLIAISIIWAGVTFFGEIVYFAAGNATCSKYLGCVDGFFGYDAFEHFFFGVMGTLLIFFLCERFPKYSILHSSKWKNFLIIIATIALVSVLWEIAECAHDAIRLDILHEPLRNVRLNINLLDQPTNLDTMGDLTLSLVGSIVGFLLQTLI